MRTVLIVLFVLTAAAFPCPLPAQDKPLPGASSPAGDYTLGPGDILLISVWKEQALTQSVPVRPDGKISFPLIGEIQAGGRTPAQIKAEMEQKLSRYVPDPVLTVMVQEIRSLLIYVIGRVHSPGRFPVYSDVNVLQALAMAGGCNPFADTKEIKIFRRAGDRTAIMNFNYKEVAAGERLEQNIVLERGDVIVVP